MGRAEFSTSIKKEPSVKEGPNSNQIVQQKEARALVGMWVLFYAIILVLMQLEVMGL